MSPAVLQAVPYAAEILARRARMTPVAEAVWRPLPGPQSAAYDSLADEVFYGGAAGGGKSDLLLGLAGTRHIRSIIFRREFPQLREIVERARTLYHSSGDYNEQAHLWRLHGNRLVEFGACQYPRDVEKYQGRAHDLKAFDELPQFTEAQFRFLIGWNRTTVASQRCRVVGAGNPPTSPEGEWVIKRWAPWLDAQHPYPATAGELRWFATLGDGREIEVGDGLPFVHKDEQILPRSRTFIPASLSDNPYLLDTGYTATLQGLPEPLRSQMLYGSFTAGHLDDPWQVIPTAWVLAAQNRWRAELRPSGPMTAVGVDVARGGKDQTVLARRWAQWFAPLERHPGRDTPDGNEGARLVLAALADGGTANVDVIGVGASVYDLARLQGANAMPISFSEAAWGMDRTGLLRFTNLRAWAWWSLREALDPDKGDGLMLPPDAELRADLCAPHWAMRVSGIQVEQKDDVIRRIGRSPDAGDAVVMAAMTVPSIGMTAL
ncbi:MAG TPA: terminase [Chloroflexota bacterium]|nr:terminase [Chloroflexota bacterium]